MRNRMLAAVVLLLLLAPVAAVAQDPDDLERRVGELETVVADLEARVSALEGDDHDNDGDDGDGGDHDHVHGGDDGDGGDHDHGGDDGDGGDHGGDDGDGDHHDSTGPAHVTACDDYNEPRVYLESQAWWQPHPEFGGTEDLGHIHLGTCWPRRTLPDGTPNRISGKLDLDIHITSHGNADAVNELSFGIVPLKATRLGLDLTCTGQDTCSWTIPITVDTTAHQADGWQEFRISAKKRFANADQMFQSTTWQLYLDNGNPVDHRTTRTIIEARGWYTGAEYTTARMEGELPYSVSGTWSPRLTTRPGSGGKAVRWSFISIDPNFHHGDEGRVLLDGPGAFNGRVDIDTTQLTDGWHRLFVRADAPCDGTVSNDCGTKADGSNNNVATNSGVQVIWFFVNNS
jgi:hypothetical protein